MVRQYVVKLISTKVDKQIRAMQKKIKETFGIEISYVKASKLVAWKSQQYNINLTEKKLIEILGDRSF